MRFLLICCFIFSCSLVPMKKGSFERDSKRNYTVRVDPGLEGADDTFLRAVYEICRIYHQSGINIISKQVMQPLQSKSWIEGVVGCNGPQEQSLVERYSNSQEKFIIKKAEEGWIYELIAPAQ